MTGRAAEDHPQQKLIRRVQGGRDGAAEERTAPARSRQRAAALGAQVPGFNAPGKAGPIPKDTPGRPHNKTPLCTFKQGNKTILRGFMIYKTVFRKPFFT